MIAAQQQLPFSPPQQKKPRPGQGTGSKAGEPPAHKRPVKEEASSESVQSIKKDTKPIQVKKPSPHVTVPAEEPAPPLKVSPKQKTQPVSKLVNVLEPSDTGRSGKTSEAIAARNEKLFRMSSAEAISSEQPAGVVVHSSSMPGLSEGQL